MGIPTKEDLQRMINNLQSQKVDKLESYIVEALTRFGVPSTVRPLNFHVTEGEGLRSQFVINGVIERLIAAGYAVKASAGDEDGPFLVIT